MLARKMFLSKRQQPYNAIVSQLDMKVRAKKKICAKLKTLCALRISILQSDRRRVLLTLILVRSSLVPLVLWPG